MGNKNNKIRNEIDPVVEELQALGLKHNDDYDIVGIGDVVESVLTKFGITEEVFKSWFKISECSCTDRKKFLNGVFHWRMKRKL
jgi:hypothetical protein